MEAVQPIPRTLQTCSASLPVMAPFLAVPPATVLRDNAAIPVLSRLYPNLTFPAPLIELAMKLTTLSSNYLRKNLIDGPTDPPPPLFNYINKVVSTISMYG